MQHRILREIAETLNANSINYSVFLKMFEVPVSDELTQKQSIINTALGRQTTVGGIQQIEPCSVWLAVKNDLQYAGDSGAGPSTSAIKSEKFADLMGELETEIAKIASEVTAVESFWLKDGHPSYPVFWDFAYLFMGKSQAKVLIGAASD